MPFSLNESPYEKVGKCADGKRRGFFSMGLNESPYEKVGKFAPGAKHALSYKCPTESPYEKVGKFVVIKLDIKCHGASMKVPTKK